MLSRLTLFAGVANACNIVPAVAVIKAAIDVQFMPKAIDLQLLTNQANATGDEQDQHGSYDPFSHVGAFAAG
jgi:hypothetical protein